MQRAKRVPFEGDALGGAGHPDRRRHGFDSDVVEPRGGQGVFGDARAAEAERAGLAGGRRGSWARRRMMPTGMAKNPLRSAVE